MKKSILRSALALITLMSFSVVSSASALSVKAKCLNDRGKMVKCDVSTDAEGIVIDYKAKKYSHLDRVIEASRVSQITMGEYSRRRVAESVTLGILVSPLALFGLMSKKKRSSFGIEYLDEAGTPSMAFIHTKKKYGHALKGALHSVTGQQVIAENSSK